MGNPRGLLALARQAQQPWHHVYNKTVAFYFNSCQGESASRSWGDDQWHKRPWSSIAQAHRNCRWTNQSFTRFRRRLVKRIMSALRSEDVHRNESRNIWMRAKYPERKSRFNKYRPSKRHRRKSRQLFPELNRNTMSRENDNIRVGVVRPARVL